MKKLIFVILMLIIVNSHYGQTRFLGFTGQTGTSIDSVTFYIYCWELSVINDGLPGDTLWIWTEPNAPNYKKVAVLSGEAINLKFYESINKVYLQSNRNFVPRRVIAKP